MRPVDSSPLWMRAPLRVDVEHERDGVRVIPVGEVDAGTVDALAKELRKLHDAGVAHVVLDLRRLLFLDCAGLRVILASGRNARRDGHAFSIIAGPGPVQRVFELTGTAGYVQFDPP